MFKKLLELNPLFRECVDKLNAIILPDWEDKKMFDFFEQFFPLTEWGKIDWDKIDKKIVVGYNHLDIIPSLKKLLGTCIDKSTYIVWNDAGIPIIKTDLDAIVQNFDDVTCVAFEKFIFSPTIGYIIEVLPGGKITAGVIPQNYA